MTYSLSIYNYDLKKYTDWWKNLNKHMEEHYADVYFTESPWNSRTLSPWGSRIRIINEFLQKHYDAHIDPNKANKIEFLSQEDMMAFVLEWS